MAFIFQSNIASQRGKVELPSDAESLKKIRIDPKK